MVPHIPPHLQFWLSPEEKKLIKIRCNDEERLFEQQWPGGKKMRTIKVCCHESERPLVFDEYVVNQHCVKCMPAAILPFFVSSSSSLLLTGR